MNYPTVKIAIQYDEKDYGPDSFFVETYNKTCDYVGDLVENVIGSKRGEFMGGIFLNAKELSSLIGKQGPRIVKMVLERYQKHGHANLGGVSANRDIYMMFTGRQYL